VEPNVPVPVQAAPHGAGGDFSLIGLMLEADPVVQAVVVLLILMSVISWAIILEKWVRLMRLGRSVKTLEATARGDSRRDSRGGIARVLLIAAEEESAGGAVRGEGGNEVRGRLERAMRAAMKGELRRMEAGLPFLATVGSAAPFIGLFGTVWGIMNSFTAIAQSKDTSLAVVAPGIAEALFATALGLAAAIPAVMAYNQISVGLGRAAARMGTSVSSLAMQFSRGEVVLERKGSAA
jgi:biopolymer transport protein ExbB/TolQ